MGIKAGYVNGTADIERRLEAKIEALEKRLAELEKKMPGQPKFLPSHGVGATSSEISNPTAPGTANPE